MPSNPAPSVICQICKTQFSPQDVIPGDFVRPSIAELIRKSHPEWSSAGFICHEDLDHYRGLYVQEILETEKGELTQLDEAVVRSFQEQELISQNINAEFDRQITFGQRVADRVAEFGGSWMFLGTFAAGMTIWIVANTQWFVSKPYDPFPFIRLNLLLSCLAAIQAPVIMMSQNWQEEKDRLRGEHDYRVNLKAELEIRHLNAKIDMLLTHQWQRLLEIQQVQTDLMQEVLGKRTGN